MSKEESYTLEYIAIRDLVARHLNELEKDLLKDNYRIPGKVFGEVVHTITISIVPEPPHRTDDSDLF